MIAPERLANVCEVVTHANCADGLVSALLLKHALPAATVHFCSYGTPEHETLSTPRAGVLFADFTPKLPHPGHIAPFQRERRERDDVLNSWRECGGVIVLDHHKTARDTVEALGGVFGDEATQPGVCGATLVYEHVWRPMVPPDHRESPFAKWVERLAMLAGVRDTWFKASDYWEMARVQHAWVTTYPRDYLMARGLEMIYARALDDVGPHAHAEREASVARSAKESVIYRQIGALRVAIVPSGGEFLSDVAEAIADADLVVGFAYRVREGELVLNLSLRSRRDVDCAAIAKAHGGGGHTGAAGCTIAASGESPANQIVDVVLAAMVSR